MKIWKRDIEEFSNSKTTFDRTMLRTFSTENPPDQRGFRNPILATVGPCRYTGRQFVAGPMEAGAIDLACRLPRGELKSALGFPGPRNIGVSLSQEIRSSPAKPDGKGSKRKQDDLDDDEEEEDHPSPAVDPDNEPSSVETDTEEYASHNNTESDLELSGKGLLIEDVHTAE
uniref:Uncharacterized protein n=1 Tax=Oryzias latipes TaxID=8090 RepID=A0A3P9HQQ1_ORYLA